MQNKIELAKNIHIVSDWIDFVYIYMYCIYLTNNQHEHDHGYISILYFISMIHLFGSVNTAHCLDFILNWFCILKIFSKDYCLLIFTIVAILCQRAKDTNRVCVCVSIFRFVGFCHYYAIIIRFCVYWVFTFFFIRSVSFRLLISTILIYTWYLYILEIFSTRRAKMFYLHIICSLDSFIFLF